jgi:1-acyl-sn-glycerol-3-phosphate acyltransferase
VISGILRFFSIAALTAACSLATLAAARLSGFAAAERVMGWWGRAFLRLSGCRLRVEGIADLPAGGAVLVSNHQSLVDIPLLLAAFPRPVKFLAKRELGEIPLFGQAMAAAGNLFVDREDPRDTVQLLREAGGRVRAGSLLIVFPEGTRSADGSVGEFKAGAFFIAQRSGMPVVPVYIDGGNKALPKGSLRMRPTELFVRVMSPLTVGEGAGGSKEQIAGAVRGRILAAQARREGER